MKKIIEQLGTINISKSHLTGWRKVECPTLKQILTHNISPTKFKSRKTGVKHTGFYNFFVIDWDSDKKGFKKIIKTLKSGNISYLAFPSPSHIQKLKVKEYRMRILVPIRGQIAIKKEEYEAQYLCFILEMGLPMPDKTASDPKRFFYPPLMQAICEPQGSKKKPRDYKNITQVEKKIKSYHGEKYPLRTIQEAMGKSSNMFPENFKKNEKTGHWERSKKKEVHLPANTVIKYQDREIGTFEKLASTKEHYRCDCPFKDAVKHSDGKGRDYAFLQGDKIICQSNTHGHLIGRLEDELLGVIFCQ